jgi:hypothetical protein
MRISASNDSLRYFAATIAQMAETLREFGISDAADSLEKAREQIEVELSESSKSQG